MNKKNKIILGVTISALTLSIGIGTFVALTPTTATKTDSNKVTTFASLEENKQSQIVRTPFTKREVPKGVVLYVSAKNYYDKVVTMRKQALINQEKLVDRYGDKWFEIEHFAIGLLPSENPLPALITKGAEVIRKYEAGEYDADLKYDELELDVDALNTPLFTTTAWATGIRTGSGSSRDLPKYTISKIEVKKNTPDEATTPPTTEIAKQPTEEIVQAPTTPTEIIKVGTPDAAVLPPASEVVKQPTEEIVDTPTDTLKTPPRTEVVKGTPDGAATPPTNEVTKQPTEEVVQIPSKPEPIKKPDEVFTKIDTTPKQDVVDNSKEEPKEEHKQEDNSHYQNNHGWGFSITIYIGGSKVAYFSTNGWTSDYGIREVVKKEDKYQWSEYYEYDSNYADSYDPYYSNNYDPYYDSGYGDYDYNYAHYNDEPYSYNEPVYDYGYGYNWSDC